MFIYLASAPIYRALSIGKLGHTQEPYGRRSTYLTGCPPGLTPSHDIEYDAIWETTATTREELVDHEDEVHNYFLRYRMMREKPGDSEWFHFHGKTPYEEVKRFMETRPWTKRQVPLADLTLPKRLSRYLRRPYHKNLAYLKHRVSRNSTLNRLQEPVVSAIAAFMAEPDHPAGYVIAPCGSGKTVMTSRGIRDIQTLVICCPSKQIQEQWRATLVAEGIFQDEQIHMVGGAGTTDPSVIRTLFEERTFCILTTYMSSHLLVDIVTTGLNLLVLDEAHHMAGIVAKDEKGEGRTRRLMRTASERGIKRLSLTYTPRFIADTNDNTDADAEYLTMDDVAIFGKKIAELNIRDLIRQGVLPDYRLWTLRDEAKKGSGIIGKAECILEAWGATEMVRDPADITQKVERPILHHLIVFASTTQEARDLEQFFKAKTADTLVLRVEEGDRLEEPLTQFTLAPRAILVNCFVLNEGVDIPIANAVAITYPKQSRGQITQMVLRAGRWYEGKALFHILLPALDDEDLSGFEEVLMALASCDQQVRDEIVLRSTFASASAVSDPLLFSPDTGDVVPECIMIEEFNADQQEIKRCFTNIRKNLFPAKERRRIQELCIEKGVDTSVEYALLRIDIPELPEDPRPKAETWYDYLHPHQKISHTHHISARDFVERVLEPNHLRVGHVYDSWLSVQPPEMVKRYPSVQHINDGFFSDIMNFNTLLEKYGKKPSRRR